MFVRSLILFLIVLCVIYTIKRIVGSFEKSGISDSLIVLKAFGDCETLEFGVFSAKKLHPKKICIIKSDVSECGEKLCSIIEKENNVVFLTEDFENEGLQRISFLLGH